MKKPEIQTEEESEVGRAEKTWAWVSQRHSHIYGGIGVLGVLLAAAALLIDRNADVHLPVDDYTRRQVEDRVRDYRAAEPLPQRAASADRIYANTDDMPNPISTGFRVVSHEVVVNLHHFRDLPSIELPTPSSAVFQSVKHQIRKISEADTFNAMATTSGLDVFFQSRTPLTVYANDDPARFGPYRVKRRIVEFDVADFPVGAEFTIQHSKTYWNAFQGEDQSWAGYEVRVPTDEIDYLIIFPTDRPFDEIEFFANNSDGSRRKLDREAYVLKDENNTWLWWRAVNPQPGTSYNIDWEW